MLSTRLKFLLFVLAVLLMPLLVRGADASLSGGETQTYLALVQTAPESTPPTEPTSTATPTLPPEPTPTATATTTPVPSCSIFADDFSDPTSGWGEFSDENYEMSYDNGEYRILMKEPIGTSAFNAVIDLVSGDFTASVDARWESAPSHAYGLGFYTSFANGSDQYVVLIEPGLQQYRVEYFNIEDGPSTLIPDTPSMAILEGTQTNRLTIQTHGTEATIYINNVQVNSFPVEPITESYRVRLAADAFPDYPTPSASRFDNFCLD